MGIFNIPNTKASRVFFMAAISLIAVLSLILATGTIYGLARPPGAEPILSLGRQPEAAPISRSLPNPRDDIRVFSGIGRLRIPLSNSSTMILSVAFPFPANDTAFTEELAARINDFRQIAVEYFSSLPPESLIFIDEESAKIEILRRYNNILRLGRIEALYFSDMMVIDL